MNELTAEDLPPLHVEYECLIASIRESNIFYKAVGKLYWANKKWMAGLVDVESVGLIDLDRNITWRMDVTMKMFEGYFGAYAKVVWRLFRDRPLRGSHLVPFLISTEKTKVSEKTVVLRVYNIEPSPYTAFHTFYEE